ncbi:hypothetical protein RJ639_017357, partial [Escallonia herrerae]
MRECSSSSSEIGNLVRSGTTSQIRLDRGKGVANTPMPTTVQIPLPADMGTALHMRRGTKVQLAESFRGNFLTSRIQRKNSSALFRIVQGPKESLKSYYARFNVEKLLIDHLDSGVTFAAMARGVRPGTPLHFSLNKRPPENMTDLLDIVEKYLRAKEDSAHPQEEPSSNQKASTSLEFNDFDLEGVICPHDDALVITLQMDAYSVKRILVDTGSSADIIFEEAFSQIGISKERVKPISSPLYGFTGASAPVEGIIPLTIIAGTAPLQSVQTIDFLVVKVRSSYNRSLGRTGLNKLRAVASTYHLAMKFPTPQGVGVVKGDQATARKYYITSCKAETFNIDDQRDEQVMKRPTPIEKLDSKQFPIYYVSKVLQIAELRYVATEKLAFALLIAARKLHPYFQSHTITVLTDKPLRRILHKPDLLGRLVLWSVELGEFDIQYKPRPSIKGQALANFIVECTLPIDEVKSHVAQPDVFAWMLYVNGLSNTMGSGAGLILKGPDGLIVEYALRFHFQSTNNEAKYETLIAGMHLAHAMRAQTLSAYSDSQL